MLLFGHTVWRSVILIFKLKGIRDIQGVLKIQKYFVQGKIGDHTVGNNVVGYAFFFGGGAQ